MAKTSSIEKNNKRAALAKQYAGKRAALKKQTKDQSIPMDQRFAAQLKLSRIALRQLGNLGQIPGLVKSSW